MEENLRVSLNIQDTRKIVDTALGKRETSERIDSYEINTKNGDTCVVLIYKKYYFRARERLTLTVVIDDFVGTTRVHCTCEPSGLDWGTSKNFIGIVLKALSEYRVK